MKIGPLSETLVGERRKGCGQPWEGTGNTSLVRGSSLRRTRSRQSRSPAESWFSYVPSGPLQSFAREDAHAPRCRASLGTPPGCGTIPHRNKRPWETLLPSPVSARGISVTRHSLTDQTATHSTEDAPKHLTPHTSALPQVGWY